MDAPAGCGTRDRAEDAADGALQIARMLGQMDSNVIQRMIQAREAALNIHRAFPGGDQRFIDAEDDDDDEVGDHDDLNNDAQDGDDEEDDLVEEEACTGLFDDGIDAGPQACLRRVVTQYEFNLIEHMDDAQLDILQRIRIVNWIRTLVRIEKQPPVDVIARTKEVFGGRGEDMHVLETDAFLSPVIEGDLLLTALESSGPEQASPSVNGTNGHSASNGNGVDYEDSELVWQAVQRSLENM